MTSRQWRPIAPLVPQPNRDFSADDDLRQQWLSQRSNVEHTSLTALHRSWAIETSIIEGPYWLDDAQTRTLIEQGFVPTAIPLSGTGQDPDNLPGHPSGPHECPRRHLRRSRSGHSINRSTIRQLHQVIVAHQPTYRAMNQSGQWFDATLHAGAFKTLPNNPTRPDGVLHHYCPPSTSTPNSTTYWAGTTNTPTSRRYITARWRRGSTTGSRRSIPSKTETGGSREPSLPGTGHLVKHHSLLIVITHHDHTDCIDGLESAYDGN